MDVEAPLPPVERLAPDQVDSDHGRRVIGRGAAVLRNGGLVAFPTETVYGLGALPSRPDALERLFQVKGRPKDKPLIMHVADEGMARPLAARWPATAQALAGAFWPGPLTLVLPAAAVVPAAVRGGGPTVGIRVPAHPIALALVREVGEPLAAPSANPSGRPSPTTARHVVEDLGGLVDLVIDGGPAPVGVESTVIDLAQDPPVLLRPGAVPVEALRRHLPALRIHSRLVLHHNEGTQADADAQGAGSAAPDIKYRQYAPQAPVVLVLGENLTEVHNIIRNLLTAAEAAGLRTGLLLATELGDDWPRPRVAWGSLRQPETLAAGLYEGLRRLDGEGVDLIVTHGVEPAGIGLAVRNRLVEAAVEILRPGSSIAGIIAKAKAKQRVPRTEGGRM